MNLKTLLRSIFVVITGLVTLVVLTYAINFQSLPISKDSQAWGTFGDYFGGILNPVIGILNIIILIYITYQISHLEEDRAKNELEIQKKIALYGLKHDALKELNRILEMVQPELVNSESESELRIILIRNDFNAYLNTYNYLFPFFEEMSWMPLRNSMEAIAALSGKQYKSGRSLDMDKDIRPELEKFIELKTDFLNEVQIRILD